MIINLKNINENNFEYNFENENKINYYSKLLIFFIIIIFIIFSFKYFLNLKNKQIKENKNQQISNNITDFRINKTKMTYQSFTNYINTCTKLIRLNITIKDKNKFPFLSICIPVYNTEKYIERAILSVINQSFQDFEIIIVNDFSNDNTSKIINRLKLEDSRIRIINHNKNLGVYHCRVEAVLNSNGKYILFLDPDDMFLNEYLFESLYNYNLKYNLDIIEFLVYRQKEWQNYIFYPKNHILNHNHNYNKNIIYQPELSNIIYYTPRTKEYHDIICRTVWNKIYRREIQLKTIEYIGDEYYLDEFLIVADDTLLNILNFQFANNYSNINIPGYLYNFKSSSMSNGYINNLHRINQDISFFLYFKILYKYIKEFDKDRNYLFGELNVNKERINEFKKLNMTEHIEKVKKILYDIKNDLKSPDTLKDLVSNLLLNLN